MSNPSMEDPMSREICVLQQKQKSITFLLHQTRQNLKYFTDLCRTNPSMEVESLGRYSLDRITQLQVELKGVKTKLKIHNRARFRQSRSAFADSKGRYPDVAVRFLYYRQLVSKLFGLFSFIRAAFFPTNLLTNHIDLHYAPIPAGPAMLHVGARSVAASPSLTLSPPPSTLSSSPTSRAMMGRSSPPSDRRLLFT